MFAKLSLRGKILVFPSVAAAGFFCGPARCLGSRRAEHDASEHDRDRLCTGITVERGARENTLVDRTRAPGSSRHGGCGRLVGDGRFAEAVPLARREGARQPGDG